jgi:hypothetical protein
VHFDYGQRNALTVGEKFGPQMIGLPKVRDMARCQLQECRGRRTALGAIGSQGFTLKPPTPPPRLNRWAANAAYPERTCPRASGVRPFLTPTDAIVSFDTETEMNVRHKLHYPNLMLNVWLDWFQ